MNGIVGSKVEQSIQNLGKISDKGMIDTTKQKIIKMVEEIR